MQSLLNKQVILKIIFQEMGNSTKISCFLYNNGGFGLQKKAEAFFIWKWLHGDSIPNSSFMNECGYLLQGCASMW